MRIKRHELLADAVLPTDAQMRKRGHTGLRLQWTGIDDAPLRPVAALWLLEIPADAPLDVELADGALTATDPATGESLTLTIADAVTEPPADATPVPEGTEMPEWAERLCPLHGDITDWREGKDSYFQTEHSGWIVRRA